MYMYTNRNIHSGDIKDWMSRCASKQSYYVPMSGTRGVSVCPIPQRFRVISIVTYVGYAGSCNEYATDTWSKGWGGREGYMFDDWTLLYRIGERGSSNGRSISRFLTDLRPVLSFKGTDDHAPRSLSDAIA